MNMTTLAVAVALTIVALPTLAADRATTEEARKHFQRGKELYDDGDLAGALKELERSYAGVPNFKLLYNIGQIQAQQQDYTGALKSFRRFLTEGSSEVTEARRAEVLKEIDKLRTRVAELTIIVGVEGAEISIDDTIVGKSPLPESVVVNVGKRKVSVTLPNHFPALKLVDAAGLDNLTVRLDPQPMVSTPATTRQDRPSEGRVAVVTSDAAPKPFPVWIPWVATGLLAAGTTVSGIMALSASDAHKSQLAKFGVDPAQLATGASSVATRALVTDVLLGVTAAAAVGSLVFTLLRGAETPARTAVRLDLSPGGLFVHGQF